MYNQEGQTILSLIPVYNYIVVILQKWGLPQKFKTGYIKV